MRLVIGLLQGKCVLTQISQNKRKKGFFKKKCTNKAYPPMYFNNVLVTQT